MSCFPFSTSNLCIKTNQKINTHKKTKLIKSVSKKKNFLQKYSYYISWYSINNIKIISLIKETPQSPQKLGKYTQKHICIICKLENPNTFHICLYVHVFIFLKYYNCLLHVHLCRMHSCMWGIQSTVRGIVSKFLEQRILLLS